jgi:hypothetical protein
MIDHLVYGAPDLNDAVDRIKQLLGVRPASGGKHASRGTHNALLSLGSGRYLEIIAPDPEQPPPVMPRAFGLDTIKVPRLLTWAAKAPDIESTAEAARAAGYDPGAITPGSRDLPDGGRLQWRLAYDPQRSGDGLVPFLIDWQSEVHPSSTAPRGCMLLDLRGEHPDPESVGRMLAALNVDLQVEIGPRPVLIATIQCPDGTVELA